MDNESAGLENIEASPSNESIRIDGDEELEITVESADEDADTGQIEENEAIHCTADGSTIKEETKQFHNKEKRPENGRSITKEEEKETYSQRDNANKEQVQKTKVKSVS